MSLTTEPVSPASVRSEPCARHDLHMLQLRVSAEYRAMPGLRLTLLQAARLFGLDLACCQHVFGSLVSRGDLVNDGHAFSRPDGHIGIP